MDVVFGSVVIKITYYFSPTRGWRQDIIIGSEANVNSFKEELHMKLSFRWYGEDDKVTLENIRQIPGMQSIVTAVYDVPVGEVWSRESIAGLKKQVEDAGLGFDVIESIPVHEDIKLGKDTRDKYIANYCENIRRVAEAGIKCICYNFMIHYRRSDPP